MAKLYKTPGVYVEEISKFPSSVSSVETAIPAFIGRTEIIKDLPGSEIENGAKMLAQPVRITSMLEYEQHFGLGYAENIVFSGTGTPTITDFSEKNMDRVITVKADRTAASGRYMYYALQMFYANGGGPCYIVPSGTYESTFNDEQGLLCLNAIGNIDEPTILIFTDKHEAQSDTSSGYGILYKATLKLCCQLKDRIAIFDPWVFTPSGSTSQDVAIIRADVGTEGLSYGCAYYPWLRTNFNYCYDETAIQINHQVNGDNGPYQGLTLASLKASDYSTYLELKKEIDQHKIDIPPSGAIAGVMASIDRDRGVWKTPANVSLRMVSSPTLDISNAEQEGLNVDPEAGKSINAIRSFTGKGVLVWGARTLAGNNNDWRYVSVRRFCNFVEERIKKAMVAFTFEPNDANTWIRVKAMCENFLSLLWKQGALMGTKPDQSFFVNVGLNVTMTAVDLLEGRMIIEIGLATTKPAEFIIIKFTNKMQIS